VFVGLIAVVYLLAAWSIVRWIRQCLAGPLPPLPPWSLRLRRVALILAAAGIPCFAYGWLAEPYWPEVVHVRIEVPGLPTGTAPIRIAQIGDIHSDPTERLEGRLPDIIASQKPDLIVFTGDSINSTEGLPIFRRCFSRIAAIAPTYAVRGNWDTAFFADVDLFGGTGARELVAEAVSVRIRGTSLWLGGIAVGRESSLDEVLATIPQGGPAVLLYHYPDLIEDVRGRGVDLYCASHTHGGQVAIPFYGALVTYSRFGKKYESGLFHEAGTFLYVNRGIGMEGGPVPRVRFSARPEITVFDLVPKN
jgi:predicted MPP superfamily phosphohydrolase